MKYYLSLFALLLLAGCATAPEEPLTAAELYAEASELANAADYSAADEKFEELKSTYPTSPYSQQAILEQIYSYLQRREYALAVSVADEFINLYPDHPQTPYAMYMKGIVYFRQDRGILDKIGKQDSTSRDPQLMQLSYQSFRTLLDAYPDSEYSPDAANRMRYLVNGLARHNMHIARYYYEQDAYAAAIGRAKTVLESYPDSTAVEAALVVLLDSYRQLHATSAADDVRRLLELNFPDNEVLKQENP